MSVISTLLLVQSDPGVRAALQFGFEREGVDVVIAESDGLGTAVADKRPELVVAGASETGDGLSVLDSVRSALSEAEVEAPVLYVGNGVSRDRALATGASEVVDPPAFVRDLVTLGRLAVGKKVGDPPLSTGKLSDHFGLYYLIRAISAARKRCVLTLIRGLRRGELRFFDGEVTSAQIGVMHGVAALHQLLLWTEASIDLRPEELVPHRQIPLSPDKLLAAAERFLEEVRDVGGGMSPAHPYEQSRDVPSDLLADIPSQIMAVLQLFDGHRTVADVIEDSPYRVFETLRVANRLRALGIIGRTETQTDAPGAASPLAIDEWLRGIDCPEPEAVEAPADGPIDWSDVMPQPMPQIEPEAISQVVPATSATGELESSAAGAPAEDPGPSEGTIEIDESVIVEAEAAEANETTTKKKKKS